MTDNNLTLIDRLRKVGLQEDLVFYKKQKNILHNRSLTWKHKTKFTPLYKILWDYFGFFMQQTIKNNITWSSFSTVITAVFGLMGSIVISRWLGPENRGTYILTLTTSSILAGLLGSNSLHSAFTYFIGKNKEEIKQISAQSFWLVMVSGILASTILIMPDTLLQKIIPGLARDISWIIILFTVAQIYWSYLTGILIGINKIRILSIIVNLDLIISFLLQVLFLIVLDLGLLGAFYQIMCVSILKIIMVLALMIKKLAVIGLPNFTILKKLFFYAFKHYPSYISVTIFNRIDFYILAAISGPAAVGVYSLAKGLAQMLDIIEQPISRAVAPMVVSENRNRASQIVAKTQRLTILISLIVAILASLASPWLIPLVYGEEFFGAVTPFVILVFGLIFASTRMLLTFFSLQMGKPEYSSVVTIAMLFISLPMFYFFIHLFNGIGAAITFTVILMIRSVISIILFLKQTRLGLASLVVKRKDIKEIWSLIYN